MENQKLSVKEVIEITMRNLMDIRIPAGFVQEIGIPISQQISNLQECLNAIEQANQSNVVPMPAKEEADG